MALVATLALALIVGREEVGAGGAAAASLQKKADPRPNIITIMTDDQTVQAMKALPQTQALIGGHGVSFDRSYVTTSLCCPSRSTYLTGQYAHNHKVVTNVAPFGGYTRLKPRNKTLPVWLQRAGYYTAHIGKYLNGYVRKSGVPPGWDDWHGAIDSSTYQMWGYELNENGGFHTYGEQAVEDPALYQTDVYSQKAAKVITREAPKNRPFFLNIATLAPHGERLLQPGQVDPRPAPRDAGAFAGDPLPMSPSFNEADNSDKPSGIQSKPLLNAEDIDKITTRYHSELESLRSVDDLVANVVGTVKREGELNNTVFIFTSDNGFFHGEHRLEQGKVFVYEESSRVPLLIRGPGIPQGVTRSLQVANIDLAPTILDFANATPDRKVDGVSLRTLLRDPSRARGRGIVMEAWNKTGKLQFRALHTSRYVYVLHSDGEEELYDLSNDPYELQSRHGSPGYATVKSDLRRLLARLDGCRDGACAKGPQVSLKLGFEKGRVGVAAANPAKKKAPPKPCVSSAVEVKVVGKDSPEGVGARFFAGGHPAGSDGQAPFTKKIGLNELSGRGSTSIKVVLTLRDALEATVVARVPRRC